MDLYVYSDESGVFDVVHNRFFVYGGLILLGSAQKREAENKYRHAEKVLRDLSGYSRETELKATLLTNAEKGKLFRSVNQFMKFGIVVEQRRVYERIFRDKRSKQRYLDYVYKIGLKHVIQLLIHTEQISKSEIRNIHILADEHATATDGKYELRESLLKEFRDGMYNSNFTQFCEPLFPEISDVTVKFLDSAKTPLIRAADIIANRVYYHAVSEKLGLFHRRPNIAIIIQP
ncbi:MAG: DUF3800 domain-containing protein [Oscillospiraceae bacterium]|nr:DUF3800 domain-containing protein [Oscillospiraceae bacterium]